jgi:hypothetical protein
MSKPKPTQPISPPRLPSKDDLALLTHLSTLLHLLHHRNKNQHRRSTWYRHLSLFRRHLSALLTDYTTLLPAIPPTTNLERARLRTLTPAIQLRISQRLAFWQDVLVGRWQRAFSQVVADGRFSVLGLVMLGGLAGICRVVGVGEGLEVLGQEEVERVLEEFGREAWGHGKIGSGFGERVARGEAVEGERVARGDEGEVLARVDEGEAVVREDDDEGEDEVGDEGVAVARDAEEASRRRNDESDDDDEAAGGKPTQRLSSSPPPKTARTKPKPTHRLSPSPPPKVAKPKLTSTKKRTANDITDAKPKDVKKKRTTTDDSSTGSKPKEAKKKRKKGGDAIDDLFSGW